MKHFKWTYEKCIDSYYHICSLDGSGAQLRPNSILYFLPATPQNDELIQGIVERLDELEEVNFVK